MTWYTAALFYKGSSEEEASELWEERFVLIEAQTEQEAMARALSIGSQGATSYQTSSGGEFHWQFDGVARLYEVQGEHVADGIELFSRFLQPSEVASLKQPFEES